jgi:hypothetical protein
MRHIIGSTSVRCLSTLSTGTEKSPLASCYSGVPCFGTGGTLHSPLMTLSRESNNHHSIS